MESKSFPIFRKLKNNYRNIKKMLHFNLPAHGYYFDHYFPNFPVAAV